MSASVRAATPAPITSTATSTAAAATLASASAVAGAESNLLLNLNKLRSQGKLTDVTLVVEDHGFKVGSTSFYYIRTYIYNCLSCRPIG